MMRKITNVLGRSVEEWATIAQVMDEYQLKDAYALSRALSRPRPQVVEEKPAKHVEVRDSKNADRLLGYWTKRPARVTGRYYEVAVMPKMTPYLFGDEVPLDMPMPARVTFEYRMMHSADGWSAHLCFATEATLEMLMQVDGFLLPNETPAQADRRRRMS
jgi:hypothetical protein